MYKLFKAIFIERLGYETTDFSLIDKSETDILMTISLNNIICGLLCITTSNDIDKRAKILAYQIMNSEIDFFILLNEIDLVIMITDHKNTLIPQYIPLKNKNQIELICGKSFLKNLIANRGVEYYGIN